MPGQGPTSAVIPSLAYVKKALQAADEFLALEIVIMVDCGLRNGEARAVNINNVVAGDVYRVHEQIHSNTHKPAKLKHRKAGEFREEPPVLRQAPGFRPQSLDFRRRRINAQLNRDLLGPKRSVTRGSLLFQHAQNALIVRRQNRHRQPFPPGRHRRARHRHERQHRFLLGLGPGGGLGSRGC